MHTIQQKKTSSLIPMIVIAFFSLFFVQAAPAHGLTDVIGRLTMDPLDAKPGDLVRFTVQLEETAGAEGNSTLVNLSEELRADSLKSFEEATTNMISNLDLQLSNFREKIKKQPDQIKVVYRSSYSGGGGGAFGIFDGVIMLCFLVATFVKNTSN